MLAIRDMMSLTDIVISFENVLKIEHTTPDVSEIIKRSRTLIGNQYNVTIGDSIFDMPILDSKYGTAVDPLIGQLTECLKGMSLLVSLTCFDTRINETVKDVNYIGFDRTEMLAILKYLQNYVYYEKRDTFIPALTRNVSNLPMSTIKRLFTILLVLENIGVAEGVSIVSQYLYLGAV